MCLEWCEAMVIVIRQCHDRCRNTTTAGWDRSTADELSCHCKSDERRHLSEKEAKKKLPAKVWKQ